MDDTYNKLLDELERGIGYSFKDRQFLFQALTHRSYVNEAGDKSVRDNERLEFFGDAVLDFFLSEQLLRRFPDSSEGDLTRIRSSLVHEESLAGLAGNLRLGRYLRLGRGEEKSGGRNKKSILADAYEALLAAVYLDGGADAAGSLVEAHFLPLMDPDASGPASYDYKTEFQELSQALLGKTPRYQVKGASGPDHDRVFRVEVLVGGEHFGEGTGRSKKEAEQAAACEGFDRLRSMDLKN